MKTKTIYLGAIAVLLCACTTKIERSNKVRHDFAKANACPSTGEFKLPCPGYRIDHKTALACSGSDTLDNLQWLTIEAHAEKSKWERNPCPRIDRGE